MFISKDLRILFILFVIFCSGCFGKTNSTPAPVVPTGPTLAPIPLGDVNLRSSATISMSLSKNVASNLLLPDLGKWLEPTAWADAINATVVITNSLNSQISLDLSNLILPSSVPSSLVDLGSILISSIQDTGIIKCKGLLCNSTIIQAYTTGEVGPGFWNDVSGVGTPLLVNNLSMGLGAANATTIQQQFLINSKPTFTQDDLLVVPQYPLSADFTNLPIGTYKANLVLNYELITQQPPNIIPPTLSLNSFNSGVPVAGNSIHEISWFASDTNFGTAPIRIQYSVDNGVTWSLVVRQVENTGLYAWVIPGVDTSNALIQILATDNSGNQTIVQSSNPFPIVTTPPTLALGGVNQSQLYAGGSIIPLTWNSVDNYFGSNPVNLFYSTDNGNTFTPIISNQPSFGTYDWAAPSIDSQVVIKVTSIDVVGNEQTILSPSFVLVTTPPVISLTNFQGGNIFAGGTTQNITWSASDTYFGVTPIKIEYSLDGSTFSIIASSVPNNGSYAWVIPSIDSSTVQIRVTATDLVGHSTASVSPPTTIIDSTPPIVTLNSFNGGQFIYSNTVQPIQWVATDANFGPNPIEIDYSPDNGTTWNILSSSFPNSGNYNWTIPVLNSTEVLIRIIATDVVGHTSQIVSSSANKISEGTPSTMTSISGDGQVVAREQATAQPLVVQILDQFNNPALPGTVINFSVLVGDGTLSSPTSLSDGQGLGGVTYTGGPTIQNATIVASVLNSTGTQITSSFTVILVDYSPLSAVLSSPTSLEYVSSDLTTGTLAQGLVGLASSAIPLVPNVLPVLTGGSPITISDVVPVNPTVSPTLLSSEANLTSGSDPIGLNLVSTFMTPVVGGTCSIAPSSFSFAGLSCNILQTPSISMIRNQITTGSLAVRVFSTGFGPLDFLDSNSLNLKSSTLNALTNTNPGGTDLDRIATPVVFNGLTYFSAENANGFNKLFSYDPIAKQIVQISDINSGDNDNVTEIIVYGSQLTGFSLYFIADLGEGIKKLFQYTPSLNTITQISDIEGPGVSDELSQLINFNSTFYFVGSVSPGQTKLYSYCGVGLFCGSTGVNQVSDMNDGDTDEITGLTLITGTLYFSGKSSSGNTKLFSYCDGVLCGVPGINQIADVSGTTTDDNVTNLVGFASKIYFVAQPILGDNKLFSYDPINNQLNQELEINIGGDDQISNLTPYGNLLMFSADINGIKLFSYDVSSGTPVVTQISNITAFGSDFINNLLVYNNSLFFQAIGSTGYAKLYRYNSTNSKIDQISDLNFNATDDPQSFFNTGTELYVRALSGANYKAFRYCEPDAGCIP